MKGWKEQVLIRPRYIALRLFFSFIFLPSIYTLPSGTPRPVCPPSSAIHFSLLNYSSNVEVFICSSVSQCVCVCPVLRYYYGWQQKLSAWHGGESLHTNRRRGGKKRDKKQMNGAERWVEMERGAGKWRLFVHSYMSPSPLAFPALHLSSTPRWWMKSTNM